MYKAILAVLVLTASSYAFAHAGGVDEKGCHNTKAGARHCHGENAGKYIPMTEEKRIEKLHKDTCNSIDGEGRKARVDLYGKKCRSR